MYARVGCQFGVEGAGEEIVLASGDDSTVDGGEYVYALVNRLDIRGTDKCHRDIAERAEGSGGREAGELSAVRIAAGGDTHGGKMRLFAACDGVGKQDQTGARAEGGQSFGDACAQWIQQIRFAKQFALDGAFATGEDKRVEGTVEVGALSDLDRICIETGEHCFMLDECSLQSEDCDTHFISLSLPSKVRSPAR